MYDVLMVNGSPHADGITSQRLDAARQAFSPGTRITDFHAYDARPLPCLDCRACERFGECAQRDLDPFYKALENSRFFVVGSPVYNGGFPAPLKAVIDRLQVYYNAQARRGIRPSIPKSRKAVLLLTCGRASMYPDGTYTPEIENMIRQFRQTLTILNGTLCFVDVCGNTDHPAHLVDILTPSLTRIRQGIAEMIR